MCNGGRLDHFTCHRYPQGFILRNKKGANLSEVYHLFQPLVVDLDQQSVSNGMGKITSRQLNPVPPNTTTL